MEASRLLARGELITGTGSHDQEVQHRDDALAAFGLVLECEPGEIGEVFHLWPEHLPALSLWAGVQTQWRTGAAGGITGLDYAGVRAAPAFRRIAQRDRESVFDDVCVMERAALVEWAALRAERDRRG